MLHSCDFNFKGQDLSMSQSFLCFRSDRRRCRNRAQPFVPSEKSASRTISPACSDKRPQPLEPGQLNFEDEDRRMSEHLLSRRWKDSSAHNLEEELVCQEKHALRFASLHCSGQRRQKPELCSLRLEEMDLRMSGRFVRSGQGDPLTRNR